MVKTGFEWIKPVTIVLWTLWAGTTEKNKREFYQITEPAPLDFQKQQELKWIVYVTQREDNKIIKMMIFPMTSNKRLARIYWVVCFLMFYQSLEYYLKPKQVLDSNLFLFVLQVNIALTILLRYQYFFFIYIHVIP